MFAEEVHCDKTRVGSGPSDAPSAASGLEIVPATGGLRRSLESQLLGDDEWGDHGGETDIGELFAHPDSKKPRLDPPTSGAAQRESALGSAAAEAAAALGTRGSTTPPELPLVPIGPDWSKFDPALFITMMQKQNESFQESIRVATMAAQAAAQAACAAQAALAASCVRPAAAAPAPAPRTTAPKSEQTPVGEVAPTLLDSATPPQKTLENLPEAVKKHLDKVAKSFEHKVSSFIRNGGRLECMKSELDALKKSADESTFKYPAGVRPFRSPVELAQLDEAMDQCRDVPFTMSLILPKGCTRRDAMRRMHHACCTFLKEQHTIATAQYQEELKGLVTKSKFLEACNAWTPQPTTADGLEDPVRPALDTKLARNHAEKLYTSLIDRARQQRDKVRKEQEEKNKQVKVAEEKLLKEKPANILKELVRNTVADMRAETAASSSMEDVPEEDAPDADEAKDPAEKFVEAVRRKQSTKANAKAKAKAKAKSAPGPKNGGASRAGSRAPNKAGNTSRTLSQAQRDKQLIAKLDAKAERNQDVVGGGPRGQGWNPRWSWGTWTWQKKNWWRYPADAEQSRPGSKSGRRTWKR